MVFCEFKFHLYFSVMQRKFWLKFCFLVCIISSMFAVNGYGQGLDTIKVMSYNLLKFPGTHPERIDTLEKILHHVLPDILVVCELTSGSGADDILYNALNEGPVSNYDMVDFIDGHDTDNTLFFNSDKLGFSSQTVIPTSLRNINEYVLYHKSDDLATREDTIFFYVYACHLKAGSTYEAQRNSEVMALKNHLNLRVGAENILVAGDFNFYNSTTEPGWNTLLNSGDVKLNDPIDSPGNWHNSVSFASIHTQSTRTTDIDGGVYGGMDDRFDFIFIGDHLLENTANAKYIEGSYKAIGQDGLRFNNSLIDSPTNTSEPFSIIESLYWMSDHLPVQLSLVVNTSHLRLRQDLENENFICHFDQSNSIMHVENNSLNLGEIKTGYIYGIDGLLIDSLALKSTKQASYDFRHLRTGVYLFKLGKQFTYKFVKN